MICTSGAVICEPPMIVGVASTIVSGRGMVLCSRKIIGDVARLIVSVAEKIELLTALIAEGMEILLSQPVTIADDVEIIVEETELIVTTVSSRGRREERGRRNRCVSDVNNQRFWLGLSSSLSCLPIGQAPFRF